MIYQGSQGSINCYYKNKLIISRPLTKKRTVHWYARQSNSYMVDALRHGWTLEQLKKINIRFMKQLRYKGMAETPTKEDWDIAIIGYFMLCKLNVIDCDGITEGFLIMPRRENRSRQLSR